MVINTYNLTNFKYINNKLVNCERHCYILLNYHYFIEKNNMNLCTIKFLSRHTSLQGH